MKKVIVCMLLCLSLLTVSAFLFTGCGDIVDIGGSYKEVKADDISTLVKDMELKTEGNYELKTTVDMSMSADGMSASGKSDISVIINYVSETEFSMSGSMKVSASSMGESQNIDASFYADSEYVYVNADGQKVKESYASSDISGNISVPETSAEALEMYASMSTKIELADEGSVKKIKYTMDGSSIMPYPGELYVVIKDGNIEGVALKCSINEEGISMTMDVQMGKTNKTVSVPSDLDSYIAA